MSQVVEKPEVQGHGLLHGRWVTIIFNNDVTPFDAVIKTLIHSTGCSVEEAEIEAWEAHTFGKAGVHYANRDECEGVAKAFLPIGVITQVEPEWND